MSTWRAKRFWKSVVVGETDGAYEVLLDGRTIRTPAKTALKLPTAALADLVAQEWEAQDEQIDPGTMPMTRLANSAIDKVAVQKSEVAAMLADYGDADLLCYRAEHPDELVKQQAEAWDPIVAWANEKLGTNLIIQHGVMHVSQDSDSLKRLRQVVEALDEFSLCGLHDLVCLSGSLILGIGVSARHLQAQVAWDLSRIDENWQEKQWGSDEEAVAVAEAKRNDFLNAATFFYAAGGQVDVA